MAELKIQKAESIARLIGFFLNVIFIYWVSSVIKIKDERFIYFILCFFASFLCCFVADLLIRRRYGIVAKFRLRQNQLVWQGWAWIGVLLVVGFFLERRLDLESQLDFASYAAVIYFWMCAFFSFLKYIRN